MKNTPLQQAQSGPMNDSSPTLNVKSTGLGLSRSASIMSQASHVSESGSSKGRNTVRNFVHRDWLGRSRSQPRLPQYPNESHVSIHSERSSMEDRAKSPPNSSSRVLLLPPRSKSSLILSIFDLHLTVALRHQCQQTYLMPIPMTASPQSDSQTPSPKQLSAKKRIQAKSSSTKKSKNTHLYYLVHLGPRKEF